LQAPVPLWKRFIAQFDDKMVKILLAAAGISSLFAITDSGVGSEDEHSFVEPMVIVSILLLNAAIGVWQESNAEKAIDALSSYNPDHAKVLRGGRLQIIEAKELVPGDIVEVSVGDKVPADLRVIEMHSTTLSAEQAALTGEAAGVAKCPNSIVEQLDAELSTKDNCLFSGTDLVYGKCRGTVIKTGSDTEIGKIAKALSETVDTSSPLREKLDTFGDLLTNIITVVCAACWAINLPKFTKKGMAITGRDDKSFYVWSKGAMYFFKIAIVLAVAAIPEGLPAVVTTCLALGTRRLAKKNALIRHLPAVETLGCTSIICSDKTGTLTTNQMSVQKVLLVDKGEQLIELDVQGITYEPRGEIHHKGNVVGAKDFASLNELCKVASLCNESGLTKNDKTGLWERVGESTESALKVLCEKIGVAGQTLGDGILPVNDWYAAKHKKVATLEFNRERKSMSVLTATPGDEKHGTLLVKGATEMVLKRCNKVRLADGSTQNLTAEWRKRIIAHVEDTYASGKMALRCLAHAVSDKKISCTDGRLQDPKCFADLESDLTFLGVTGILDPPRNEVKPAIEKCKKAGIRILVITGDNPKTAETICRMIGIFDENEDTKGKSFTGREFAAMSLEEKKRAVFHAKLFSRTEPMHKKDIVQLLQLSKAEGGPGETAAMTGDGVNDAPALKAADIGVAMGTGTSVAQGAAKMILADDNFTTIVSAVEEGRGIYANTKAFIRYLISSNIGEVVCVFLSVLLGLPEVLSPVALLWVNLVTDGLPATALSFNPVEPGIMDRPPRDRNEALVDRWMLVRYLVTGSYVGIATVSAYIWWMCSNKQGPMMKFSQLVGHLECGKNTAFSNGYKCDVFSSTRPTTVALSTLVTIEMFNALNAITETKSLFTMSPLRNGWLVAAVAGSFLQHLLVLSWPTAEIVFRVTTLNWPEVRKTPCFAQPLTPPI
jgi:Ca2+ transporting ATPase